MVVELLLAVQVATCDDCVIRATRRVILSDPQGLGVVSQPTGITRMRNGQWILTHAAAPDKVNLFTASGSFIRAVGRNGSGPGEYRAATLASAGPGDSIWVFDQGLKRMTILDSSLRYVRSFTVSMPAVSDMMVIDDGRVIARADIRTEERAGYPLHILDHNGSISRSFGTDTRIYRADRPSLSRRSFWPTGRDTLWLADVAQYRIQLWSLDGGKIRELIRRVDWFPPHEDYAYPSDLSSAPHPPGLISVHQDSNGVLWTVVRVADPQWRTAVGNRRNALGRIALGIINREKYWDTIIEALDPTNGRVFASVRLDGVLQRFVADRMAFQYVEDPDGEPSIVIWEFSLTSRQREASK